MDDVVSKVTGVRIFRVFCSAVGKRLDFILMHQGTMGKNEKIT